MMSIRDESVWPTFYFTLVAMMPGHLLDWGVEWSFAATTTVAGLLLYPRFHRIYPRISTYGLLAILLVTLISVFSYIATLVFGRFETGLRDLVDLFKPGIIYFSCTLGFIFGTITLQQARNATAYILIITLICTIVIVIQPPVLFELVQIIYSSTKTNISDFNFRVSIPFENPNFLGLFSIFSLCIALFIQKPDLRLTILSILVIALSGSRTAWITSIGVILVFLIFAGRDLFLRQITPSLSAIIVPIVIILLGVYFMPIFLEENQRIIDFIDVLMNLDLSQDASYAERIEMRANALSLIMERIFFGWGSIKYSNLDVVDNEYVSLLLRFGIFGSLIVLLALGFLFATHVSHSMTRTKGHHVVLFWIVALAWMWVGSFAENIRLSILLTMLFASTISSYEKYHS